MKRRWKFFSLPGAGALLFGVGLSLGLPSAAQAQYPCGNGPGPGEVVVGQTGGSSAHAPILLCQYVGGDSDSGNSDASPFRAPSRPIIPMKPGFMAAAHHPDTSSVWMSAGHRTSEAAKARALDGCNRATGGGCVMADTLSEFGWMYVAEDAMGLLWIKGTTAEKEKDNRISVTEWNAAIELCARNSFGCKFLGFIQTGQMPVDDDPNKDYSSDHFPKGSLTWNRWALVARPEKTPAAAWQNKSWLSTGQQKSAAARAELLARCQSDSGVPCAISAFAANGALVQFVDGVGKIRWTSAAPGAPQPKKKKKSLPSDRTSVAARIERLCPPSIKPCRVVATYDAATPRMQIIEDVK